MEHKLVKSNQGDCVVFDFVGYDDWKHFVSIMNIVKKYLKPDELDYKGITDMNGFFKKNGICVKIEYNEMIGNSMIYNTTNSTSKEINKVSEWATLIFNKIKELDTINE